MAFVYGTDMTGLGQAALSGDVNALFPRKFSSVFQAHLPFTRYVPDSMWINTPVAGFDTKTNERLGDILGKAWVAGYNIAVPLAGGGGPEIQQALKRDRYILQIDSTPYVLATHIQDWEKKKMPDGGANFEAKTPVQFANTIGKAEDLNCLSALLQTASIADPVYFTGASATNGRGEMTKQQAGTLAFSGYAATDADAAFGLVVNTSIVSADPFVAGSSFEAFLSRLNTYATHKNWNGRKVVLVASTVMRAWADATGRVQNLTAASNFVPTRAFSEGGGSYNTGMIASFRGFTIVECPYLDSLGTIMDGFFASDTIFGAAAGSKYLPGSSYNSTNAHKMSVARIATQVDLGAGCFEQGAGANNPTQWASGAAHYTLLAYDKVRAIAVHEEALEKLTLLAPSTDAWDDKNRFARQFLAAKLTGYGPNKSEDVLYLAGAKG